MSSPLERLDGDKDGKRQRRYRLLTSDSICVAMMEREGMV